MTEEEKIAIAKSKHPAYDPRFEEEGEFYGKVQPIELHPGVQDLEPHKPKGLRIVEECQETGEPYFVVRAKDVLGIMILVEYARLLELYRPTNFDMAEAIANARNSFTQWMDENPTAVHLPD